MGLAEDIEEVKEMIDKRNCAKVSREQLNNIVDNPFLKNLVTEDSIVFLYLEIERCLKNLPLNESLEYVKRLNNNGYSVKYF